MISHHVGPGLGRIVGFSGNMASGKTSRIMGVLHDPHVQAEGVILFQPPTASRTGTNRVRSRTLASYRGAITLVRPRHIFRHLRRGVKHICLEEIQFYDRTGALIKEFKETITKLLELGYHIYWTGLPVDYRRQPFECVKWMMSISETLETLSARCKVCHSQPAHYPQRLIFGHPAPKTHPRFVPDTDKYRRQGITYEPRCGNCHQLPDRPNVHLTAINRLLRSTPRRRR